MDRRILIVGGIGAVLVGGSLMLKHRSGSPAPMLTPQSYPAMEDGSAGGAPGGFGAPYVPYNAESTSVTQVQNRTDLPMSQPSDNVPYSPSSYIQPIPSTPTATYQSMVTGLGGSTTSAYGGFSLPKFDFANPALVPGFKLPLGFSGYQAPVKAF